MNRPALNTVIVEDEKPAARRLQRLLKKEGFVTIQVLHAVEEAVTYFRQHPTPDLLFLDIQLADGLSFEIFDQVPGLQSAMVIFTTAYDAYALRAFELKSIDYVLKPITEKTLIQALRKFDSYCDGQPPISATDLQRLKSILQSGEKTYQERFTIKIGNQLKLVEPAEVCCFSSEQKASYLHLAAAKKHYILEKSLTEIVQCLSPKLFFRINRNLIVNISHIKGITVYPGHRLKVDLPHFYQLKNQIVSRERVRDFKNWLNGSN